MKQEKVPGKVGVFKRVSTIKKYKGKPDAYFEITYKINGKKKTEKVGWISEGYSAAISAEIRAKRVRDARHGLQVKTNAEINRETLKHNKTINEIKTHYFESEKGLALKGRVTDLNRYKNHLAWMGEKRVSELTVLDMERIKKNMRHLKPATVSNALKLLTCLINYGVEYKLCPAFSFKVKFPKVDNQVTEYLTDEQAKKYLEVLDGWPRQDISRMVRMIWLTGIRRGEAFKLKTENIDFTKNIITLVNPKGGKEASIPLTEPVKRLVDAQIAYLSEQSEKRVRRYANSKKSSNWHENGFLFPGVNGNQRKDCSAIKNIKKAAGLPRGFRALHGLRHHLAVTLASSGEYNLDMIGELLTHKDTAVTRRYAKYLPEATNRAANHAADLLIQQTEKKKPAEIIPLTVNENF